MSGALIASMADRALGTLVGLAVGDAVGTTLEFRVRDSYVLLTDMVGGPFRMPPGGWTDDTAMALGLADSLVALGRFDGADIMRRWLRWMEKGAYNHTGSCFDIGNQTAAASVGGGARNTAEAGRITSTSAATPKRPAVACCLRPTLHQALHDPGDDVREQGNKKLQDGTGCALRCWRGMTLQPSSLGIRGKHRIGRLCRNRHRLLAPVEVGPRPGELSPGQEDQR